MFVDDCADNVLQVVDHIAQLAPAKSLVAVWYPPVVVDGFPNKEEHSPDAGARIQSMLTAVLT